MGNITDAYNIIHLPGDNGDRKAGRLLPKLHEWSDNSNSLILLSFNIFRPRVKVNPITNILRVAAF